MNVEEEIRKLRDRFDRLASQHDDGLRRFVLAKPPVPPGTYWKLRWFVGWLMRAMESARLKAADPWPVRLRNQAGSPAARPVVIWGVDVDGGSLRDACDKLAVSFRQLSEFAPVLITNATEFAYYSRLNWLVEYLPELGGAGDSYPQRKLRFLARTYRDAPVLPLASAAMSNAELAALLREGTAR